MSQGDGSRGFGEWLRSQRDRCGLSEQQTADLLEVSIATYVMWEVGNTPWAMIPQEYKEKIESVCSKFSITPDVESTSVEGYRQGSSTAYLEEIETSLEESDSEPAAEQVIGGSEIDAVEFICRCTAPVYLADDYCCKKCGRVGDSSQ